MVKRKVFRTPFIAIAEETNYNDAYLIGHKGEVSSIFQIDNKVPIYSADEEAYRNFHSGFLNIIKLLEKDYFIQKIDIISREKYSSNSGDTFLAKSFNAHYKDRMYNQLTTYLVITKEMGRKNRVKNLKSHHLKMHKVFDVLKTSGFSPYKLKKREINELYLRFISINFSSSSIKLDSIHATKTQLEIHGKSVQSISLIDLDKLDLPNTIAPFRYKNTSDMSQGFPVDNMHFLANIALGETIIYNQVFHIPKQTSLLTSLQVKRNKHKGIPDPENDLAVQDIEKLLEDVAKDNQTLIRAHFNLIISGEEKDMPSLQNQIENNLFSIGIIPSSNSYNQMELFRSAIPGNSVELQEYDLFLTTAESAICFLYMENIPKDEPAPNGFSIYFTDRQGIPIAIDPSDYSRDVGWINNRNKFVLGPSGSGKSFFMNNLIEQYLKYNMDIIVIDTGDSYSGTCSFNGGEYITYQEDDPITMNPFAISQEELNIEKKDFLLSLIGIIWKGAGGKVSQVEEDLIAYIISSYYNSYFQQQKENWSQTDSEYFIEQLSFDSFYEFSSVEIPKILKSKNISFDIDEFKFVLSKFYKGGEYDKTLNKNTRESLLQSPFIVFEIDNIKDNKILFPLVTLIIIDVFIQKMRHRQHQRKALIIEEAWKAIASEIMAPQILYLYKTARKFMAEVIVVTQELDDIISNETVKDSIISNSDTLCLLDQNKFKDNYKRIASVLSLNKIEQRKIFTINNLDNKDGRAPFKEVYIKRGPYGQVYGVEVSLAQYLSYTTEKPEKVAVGFYVAFYKSYTEAIHNFIKDLKSLNVPLNEFVQLINQIKHPLLPLGVKRLQNYSSNNKKPSIKQFISEFYASSLPFIKWIYLE